MSELPPAVRIRVGTLRVTACSAIEARRLADALPAALQRALRSWPTATPAPGRRSGATERSADQAAAAIVDAMRTGLGEGGEGTR